MRTVVTITGVFDEPVRNEDGSWSFLIPGRQLSLEEGKVIDSLFPDLESAVGRLLSKQAVLNCLK